MNRRIGLAIMTLVLIAVLTGSGKPAVAAATGPVPPSHALSGNVTGIPPLSWGNIELKSTAGPKLDWSSPTSSPGSTASALAAQMPNPGNLQHSFSLVLTLPSVAAITPGTTYGPASPGGVHAAFSYDFTTACSFTTPDSFIRVDQYVLNGSGAVTSYAVRFQCTATSGYQGTWSGTMAYNATPSTHHSGYYLYRQNGALTGFGNDDYLAYLGDLSANILNDPIVGMASTPSAAGYWMVASDGGIFAYGDAGYYGSMGGKSLNKPIVGMATTSDGKGYWLVASDGGIFAFGDATFLGSMGGSSLNRPIVGMARSASGGYWLVASDGGIFAFGGATFFGSTGAMRLNRPVVGTAATADVMGYWLVASDGGVFTFGNATFHGSTGALTLQEPIIGMDPLVNNSGYWLAASDGGVLSFDALFFGSLGGQGLTDVAGVAS